MIDWFHRIILSLLSSGEGIFIFNLLLSVVLGILIGHERSARGKNAGIGTFTFVIVGSMLFSYISHLVSNADSSRIAAQIVSGIGFLGAGLIFVSGENKVRNLTTAAGVRLAGAIGMAIGFGFYSVAIATSLTARLFPKAVDKYVKGYREEHMTEGELAKALDPQGAERKQKKHKKHKTSDKS